MDSMSTEFDGAKPYVRAHQSDNGRLARRLAPVAFAGMLIAATMVSNSGQSADAVVGVSDQKLASLAADGGMPWYMFPSPPIPPGPAVPADQVMPLELNPMSFTMPFSSVTYGIPESVYAAYQQAVTTTAVTHPGCNLSWQILAAVGKVESDHAWSGNLNEDGTTAQPILGPLLNGQSGVSAVSDTDDGRYDGSSEWDRAVGPMQFIPSTWESWGTDGDGDGKADPANIYDATLGASRYLCADDRDLSTEDGLDEALFSYNHSQSYVQLVLSWISAYEADGGPVPDAPAMPAFALVSAESEGGSESGSQRSENGAERRPSKQQRDDSGSDGRQNQDDDSSDSAPPPDSPEPSPVPSVPSPPVPEPGVLPKLESSDAPEPTESIDEEDYIFTGTTETTDSADAPS